MVSWYRWCQMDRCCLWLRWLSWPWCLWCLSCVWYPWCVRCYGVQNAYDVYGVFVANKKTLTRTIPISIIYNTIQLLQTFIILIWFDFKFYRQVSMVTMVFMMPTGNGFLVLKVSMMFKMPIVAMVSVMLRVLETHRWLGVHWTHHWDSLKPFTLCIDLVMEFPFQKKS